MSTSLVSNTEAEPVKPAVPLATQVMAAMILTQGQFSKADVEECYHSCELKYNELGLDEKFAKAEIEMVGNDIVEAFQGDRIYALTTSLFRRHMNDRGFVESRTTPGKLAAFFERSISLAEILWCLQPFAQGVDLDVIFHQGSHTDDGEEWNKAIVEEYCRKLCSKLCEVTYMYVLFLDHRDSNTAAVKRAFADFPPPEYRPGVRVSWKDLPAPPTTGQ